MTSQDNSKHPLDRRGFLYAGGAAAAALSTAGMTSFISPGHGRSIEASPQDKIFSTIPKDKIKVFGKGVLGSEAVLVDKQGNVYGFGHNRLVYKVSPDEIVEISAVLPKGSDPVGFAMDQKGNFFYCCLGNQAVMRLSPDGEVSMFADRAGLLKLTLPNFATFDAEGNLYVSVTNTRYISSQMAQMVADPNPAGALVRIRPDGRGEVIASGIFSANGTAISPSEDAVYVLESRLNRCLRLPMRKDGSVGKPEIYAEGFPSIPDGMAFDAEGALIVACVAKRVGPGGPTKNSGSMSQLHLGLESTNQIIRVDTDGKWTMLIEDPTSILFDHTTNCAFGGPEMRHLYVANDGGEHFTRMELEVPGHPLYHQR